LNVAVDVRDIFRVHQTAEGDAAALQGLSLAIREREVVTVLGPSGSGKSTFLRILAGLDRPSAGSVYVFGTEIGKLPAADVARYRTTTVGYADQHYARALAPELTARELVALELGLAGATRTARLRRADELLERVGLADKRDARPSELSGGEQQRVAVAASVAHKPRLFLADEPTGELDAASASLVYDTIGELVRAEECTAVIVSHDPESASIADRIVRIRDGRVSEETARSEGGQETIVVGRGGWLRLPEELLRRSGIRSHATAHLEDDHVVVTSADEAVDAPTETLATQPRPRESQVAARVRDASKVYGRGATARAAIEGLDAEFRSSMLTAVTGPSGSGKTTLLHLIAGLELPTSGLIDVLGTDIASLDRAGRARFRRDHIGYVGQQPGLVSNLSARENVELALSLRGLAAGDAARESLVAVGLEGRIDQRVSRLSTGERGRVAIARAIAARPELLLADEPTSRLDQANALAVGDLFVRLAREYGTTVVCATHDPLLIEQADETVELG
jgi:energy-coupling factor transport system ATP-binding protein